MRELVYAYQTASTQEEQDAVAKQLRDRPFWMQGEPL